MQRALDTWTPAGPPRQLVENRTARGGRDVQFAVYDTYRPARQVAFRSPHPLYCGMVTGKKHIHLGDGTTPFDFLPGESLVVPPGAPMHIDFPGSDRTPTKCVTLEMDRSKIRELVGRINEEVPRAPDAAPWSYDDLEYCHFQNGSGIQRVLEAMVALFTENPANRDLLIDLSAMKLVVHLLQTKSRRLLLGAPSRTALPEAAGDDRGATTTRLAAAVAHARAHLGQSLTAQDLAEAACMSKSSFYRYFNNEFGITPHQFLTAERMKRAQKLLAEDRSVEAVGEAVGFQSTSHFIRTFKKYTDGTTPKQYQLNI